MPGRDGTGPQGQGSMTGRGQGMTEQNVSCGQGMRLGQRTGQAQNQDLSNQQERGFGMGAGRKQGAGVGRQAGQGRGKGRR